MFKKIFIIPLFMIIFFSVCFKHCHSCFDVKLNLVELECQRFCMLHYMIHVWKLLFHIMVNSGVGGGVLQNCFITDTFINDYCFDHCLRCSNVKLYLVELHVFIERFCMTHNVIHVWKLLHVFGIYMNWGGGGCCSRIIPWNLLFIIIFFQYMFQIL